MADSSNLNAFFAHVDKLQDSYVEKLREIVAIPSVSANVKHRPDVVRMGEWLLSELATLGATTKRVEPGPQKLEGQTIALPPVILATYGQDPAKKTLLVYGHYDVQPANLSDGWTYDPFTLTESEGRLYGRGSTDDKGPILGWLCAIKAHQDLGLELPVNLKMCFEGMEESGSEGLDEIIRREANDYFKGTDAVCISDNCNSFYFLLGIFNTG